jgi:adenylate cyclase
MALLDASRQIEDTLRKNRDEAEQQIAFYRVLVFLVASLLTGALYLLQVAPGTPFAMCIVGELYAWCLRTIVARRGASHAVSCLVVAVDMLFGGAVFVATRIVEGHRAPGEEIYFPLMILPAVLFLLSALNALRYSRTTALLGGVLAVAVFIGVELAVTGFHTAEIPVGILLGLAGVVNFAAAQRARLALDRFARLQLLRRYLSPAAVERVLQDNPDQALALGGELRTVTLLAADLRDFTAMSERLSAQEVVAQLNEYHGTMLAEIDRQGGLLDKFIGDGTLAIFGLPLTGSPAPVDAGAAAGVACSRAMRVALTALNARRAERSLPALQMGIGVHTGQVIAGNIGAPGRRLEFTVIGDSVNTVSRLEGLTKETGVPVLVSAATAGRLASQEGLRPLPTMRAKGKKELIEVLAVS